MEMVRATLKRNSDGLPCKARRAVRLGEGMRQIVPRHPGMQSAENELTPPQRQDDAETIQLSD